MKEKQRKMKYKILEHKADIKIKVSGKTLEDLFKNAVFTMASILFKDIDAKFNKFKFKKIIITKSADKEILLADFLNDVLGESQIKQAVFPNVRFIDFQPEGMKEVSYLKAEISGYPIERFDEDIKAATYHDLKISQNKGGVWEATILFDV
jgi:SHS2 domain-containing protein